MSKRTHNKKEKQTFRKELRNNLTPAEAYLWNYLKGRQRQGRKFRRQHGIENFIVDFYCYEEKLVIELDGEVHNHPDRIIYDAKRSKRLMQLGNTVLRFENKMVFENLSSVLNKIAEHFNPPPHKKAPSLD
ncbi:endonuclease domain-containing protein [Flavobacteriaceae bacterium 3-367]|uniref:endonuclease domain-containing protein n=1 Tax=Eudoraea algarum TaxID=3417568 RepID=UPI003289844A